jgi:hypothetical protein
MVSRLFRQISQKPYTLCRSRVKRPILSARPGTKSHEFPEESSTHAETGPHVQKVIALASRIASMSDQDVRERYHELIDERPRLSPLERFELERIEARLDAEDRDAQLEVRERKWREDRAELINSVEKLLVKLRSPSVEADDNGDLHKARNPT